ncbi:MAG: energy transducer TonB [Bacteroidota bacterium]
MMNKRQFTLAALLLGLTLVLQSNKCKDKHDSAGNASADMNRAFDSIALADSMVKAFSEFDRADSIRKAELVMDSIRVADSTIAANTPQERPHPPALPLEPTYKEGRAALEKFLAGNAVYPEAARKNKITGFVVVGFIVKKDGSLSDFKVLKGLGYGCDEEALRVAKLMPPWNPGKKGGQAVDMEYNVSVKFGMK